MLNSFAFYFQHILRGTEVEEIGNCLPAVLRRHARQAEPQLAEILAPLWSRVVGPRVAEHSRPVAFWSGTLTVGTPCATWAAQLRELREEILRAVNDYLGGTVVRELRVKLVPSLAGAEDQAGTPAGAKSRVMEARTPALERSFSASSAHGDGKFH